MRRSLVLWIEEPILLRTKINHPSVEKIIVTWPNQEKMFSCAGKTDWKIFVTIELPGLLWAWRSPNLALYSKTGWFLKIRFFKWVILILTKIQPDGFVLCCCYFSCCFLKWSMGCTSWWDIIWQEYRASGLTYALWVTMHFHSMKIQGDAEPWYETWGVQGAEGSYERGVSNYQAICLCV